MIKIGNLVTRKKYNNDIVFKVVKIDKEKVYLKGIELRLYADASMDDLLICETCKKKEDNKKLREFNKSKYFYIPGVILHLDTDTDYLNRCLEYYKNQNIKCYGYCFNVEEYKNKVISLIAKHNPNIIVITGHDAYYKKTNSYKNSEYFIQTVKEIRKKYPNHEDLLIVAGACQSNYSGLIQSKATFASSPTHSNIHALDPAIIASSMSLLERNKMCDVEKTVSLTKYGSNGYGGVIVNGTLIYGYPRKDQN